ncbi:MAG: nodulation protein NfeD [Thermodesulfobacteriota bacterium]
MRNGRSFITWLFMVPALLVCAGALLGLCAERPTARPLAIVLDVNGSINPALADYIAKGIKRAEDDNAACVVIRVDTPGGLVTTTKSIVKTMLNAKIPVVVYVAPGGSTAASAGALITMAADIAAMAPGTNIGAAHPVGGGGEEIGPTMSEKVVNDLTAYMRGIVAKKGRNTDWAEKAIRESVSVTAKEALDLKVIDLIADSVPDLLQKIDGRKVEKDSSAMVLATKGAQIKTIPAGWRFAILDVVANPNIAYLLLMAGILGLWLEFYHPGAIFPGVAGGMCLLLALFALQVLPVNYVGILLMLLAIVLFILEVKVASFGLLSVGGIVCLTLGSVMLFDTPESAMRVSWSVVIPTVLSVSAFFIFAVGLAVRAWRAKPRTGTQGLTGEVGVAVTDLATEGKILVHGEVWNARADAFVQKGEKVKVLTATNLMVTVTREPAR